jgi:hypothetical protein
MMAGVLAIEHIIIVLVLLGAATVALVYVDIADGHPVTISLIHAPILIIYDVVEVVLLLLELLDSHLLIATEPFVCSDDTMSVVQIVVARLPVVLILLLV